MSPGAAARIVVTRHAGRLAVFVAVADVVVLLVLCTGAWLAGRPLWRLFAGENHAVDWWTGVQLLLAAGAGWTVFRLGRMQARVTGASATHDGAWFAFALGCLVLWLDEAFGLHEVLREHVFVPAGLAGSGTLFVPGDYGLALFLVAGVAVAWRLAPELREAGLMRRLRLALGLAAVAIFLDTLTDERLNWLLGWWRFWDHVVAETLEMIVATLLLTTALGISRARFARLLDPGAAGAGGRGE